MMPFHWWHPTLPCCITIESSIDALWRELNVVPSSIITTESKRPRLNSLKQPIPPQSPQTLVSHWLPSVGVGFHTGSSCKPVKTKFNVKLYLAIASIIYLLQLLHVSGVHSQLVEQVRGLLHHARAVNQGGEGDAPLQTKVVIHLQLLHAATGFSCRHRLPCKRLNCFIMSHPTRLQGYLNGSRESDIDKSRYSAALFQAIKPSCKCRDRLFKLKP